MTGLISAAASLSSAPLWYVTRSTGLVAFALITIATCLGVASTQRALASPLWPRFATQTLHRNVSLIGLALMVVHIVTTILDSYVNVGWLALVVPGASAYRTPWVALGTLAFDLVLIVIVTSLLRLRMPSRLWRAIHWTSYALFPLLLVHFLKTGTDTGFWGILLGLTGAALVGGCLAVRITTRDEPLPVPSIPTRPTNNRSTR